MWVPNPNPYEWKVQELDNLGVPFVKGRIVRLERNGIQRRFTGQEAVDGAWARGWHDTGRPETADMVAIAPGVVEEKEGEEEATPFTGPASKSKLAKMNKSELIAHGEGIGIDLDEGLSNADMVLLIQVKESKLFTEKK
jgi:hypothetical protein